MTLAQILTTPAAQAILVLIACSIISAISTATRESSPGLSRVLRGIAVALSAPVTHPPQAPAKLPGKVDLDDLPGVDPHAPADSGSSDTTPRGAP